MTLQGAGLGEEAEAARDAPTTAAVARMLLHIDAIKHAWFTILDDANREIYYAHLVEEEGTRTLMPAVREVIDQQGTFCALYSDRASHFFVTPRAGGEVDENQVTQLGRALKESGIRMMPAYSPPARGRMERSYRTWQGRLPQELRLRNVTAVEEANRFLLQQYKAEFNRRFSVSTAGKGSSFVGTAWEFAAPAIPVPGSILELLPSTALSPAQVIAV